MVNFKALPFYNRVRRLWHPLYRRLGGPQSRSGCFGVEKKRMFALPGFKMILKICHKNRGSYRHLQTARDARNDCCSLFTHGSFCVLKYPKCNAPWGAPRPITAPLPCHWSNLGGPRFSFLGFGLVLPSTFTDTRPSARARMMWTYLNNDTEVIQNRIN